MNRRTVRWSIPRFLTVAFCLGTPAWATNLNITVTSGGNGSISVAPGATVNYEINGELSDALHEGLALFLLDLAFDGGALTAANSPATSPMSNFVRPDGATNPAGYGGTVIAGALVQMGGSQNTIKNTLVNAAFPIGTVIMDVASPGSPLVLVTGSLTAPLALGTYNLTASNVAASVIRQGEDGAGAFWAVDLAGQGTVANLSITVAPPNEEPAIDAEGSRYLQITPGDGTDPIAFLVTPICAGSTSKYVGAPSGLNNVARLEDNPVNAAYLTPAQWGAVIHLTGTAIVPSQAYNMQTDLGTLGNPDLQPPISATTWIWADLNNTLGPIDVDDLICLLNGFIPIYDPCSLFATDLAGEDPDQLIDVDDLIGLLGAFAGDPYFGASPCP
ncbi:MAG: hypothetical protein AABZ47_16660 [Planctomycetota bacterium]